MYKERKHFKEGKVGEDVDCSLGYIAPVISRCQAIEEKM
jgi:hypothetical protein